MHNEQTEHSYTLQQHASTFLFFIAGVCLGLQAAVIEFARNVLGWKNANSTEIDATTNHPVVSNQLLKTPSLKAV